MSAPQAVPDSGPRIAGARKSPLRLRRRFPSGSSTSSRTRPVVPLRGRGGRPDVRRRDAGGWRQISTAVTGVRVARRPHVPAGGDGRLCRRVRSARPRRRRAPRALLGLRSRDPRASGAGPRPLHGVQRRALRRLLRVVRRAATRSRAPWPPRRRSAPRAPTSSCTAWPPTLPASPSRTRGRCPPTATRGGSVRCPRASRAPRWCGRGPARPLLMVGGTASIRGEESMHVGDLAAQIDETLANLASVVGAAHGRPDGWPRRPRPLSSSARVSSARDAGSRRGRGAPQGAPSPRLERLELLSAELCRPELLVEVEGLAEGPLLASRAGR